MLFRSWEFEAAGRPVVALPKPAMAVNDTKAGIDAAVAGLGIAVAMLPQVAALIEEGRLVRLLADHSPEFEGFGIYYPSRRQLRPALRAFIEHYRT